MMSALAESRKKLLATEHSELHEDDVFSDRDYFYISLSILFVLFDTLDMFNEAM